MRARAVATAMSMLAVASAVGGCAGTSTQQVVVKGETIEATSSTTSTTEPPDCATTLPTDAQAAQLLMVMVDSPSHAAEALTNGLVGGFGLKGNQRSDVDELIAAAIVDAPITPTVAVDEEGGPVQRLRYSAGRIPSAAEMSEGTPAEASATMGEHSQRMADIGITMNFAPVADLRNEDVLGDRTFSDDPATVARFVVPIADAIADAGITPVVKHWPGIGGVDTDPHDALPVLAGVEELRSEDMVPFDAVIEAAPAAVMVAHAEVPGLTAPGVPASLSREAITEGLRGRHGFDGVVITDSLGMGAVVEDRSQAEAAVQAIAAGADIALLSGADVVEAAHDRLARAIENGEIPDRQIEESVRRVLAMKGIRGECFDAISAYGRIGRTDDGSDADAATPDGSTGPGGSDGSDGSTGDTGTGDHPTSDRGTVDGGINDPSAGDPSAGDPSAGGGSAITDSDSEAVSADADH